MKIFLRCLLTIMFMSMYSCKLPTDSGKYMTSFLIQNIKNVATEDLLQILDSLPENYLLRLDKSNFSTNKDTIGFYGRPYYYFYFWKEENDTTTTLSYIQDIRLGNFESYKSLPDSLLKILEIKYGTGVKIMQRNFKLP